jgi:predicted AAA+ superfamily ATPase
LGSRQVGKTTLAKMISSQLDNDSVYLDLENPSDNFALDHPVEFFNAVGNKAVIIDEIQRRPELFPVLRSVIDSNRTNGRFILLGSASKDLLLMSNETLAGRVVYNELTPFLLKELNPQSDFRVHWLRGGYPTAFFQNDDSMRNQWLRSFVSAYIERDLRMLGLGSSPNDVQRLFYMLASVHGSLLNYSTLANSLGISVPTVRNIISYFEKSFIIRIIQPWFANIGKRLIKTPKVYFRDSGIINFMLGLNSFENLLRHQMLGQLWEGYVIENIISTLGDQYQYYFYRTADGAECDLVIFEGSNCKAAVDAKFSPAPKSTRSMTTIINDLKPRQSYFVVPECSTPFSIGGDVTIATPDQAINLLR